MVLYLFASPLWTDLLAVQVLLLWSHVTQKHFSNNNHLDPNGVSDDYCADLHLDHHLLPNQHFHWIALLMQYEF